MMSERIRFHEPLTSSITYLRGAVHENPPVNMSLVEAVRKSRMCWYPDNNGKPSIVFEGTKVVWAFDNEADRDGEFARVLEKFG